MIPKVAHFYWGSGQPMSFLRSMTLRSFDLFNPDWKIVVHLGEGSGRPEWATRELQDSTEYEGPDFADDLPDGIEWRPVESLGKSHVHTKDLLAWEVLETEGGVFADMDILWTDPLDDLGLSGDACLVEFSGFPKPGYIPVTLMASAGESALFGYVNEIANERYRPDVYECCGAGCFPGSIEDMREQFGLDVVRLPDTAVFPYAGRPFHEAIKALHGMRALQESGPRVGIHWYAGNPISQRVNGEMRPGTLSRFHSPLAEDVARCLALSSL